MQLTHSRTVNRIAACAIILTAAVTLAAQGPASTAPAAGEQIRVVDLAQRGTPPTGPHAVVIEHDQRLATHTIYRPATLGPAKHSVLVWGEGGCAKNGLTFPEYLSEIASHGFVVMADGPPIMPTPRGQGGAGAAAGAPRGAQGGVAAPTGPAGPPQGQAAGAPAAGAPAAGAPRGGQGGAAPARGRGGAGGGINADGTPLIAAIDWLQRESADARAASIKRWTLHALPRWVCPAAA